MKIVIPVLGFGKAGGHRVLSNFATEWTNLGHEVLFVCPKDYHDLYYPTSAKVEYISTVYSLLPNFLRRKIVRDFFGLVALFFALLKRTRTGDLVVANRDLTAFPVRAVSIINKSQGLYYIQAYEPDFYEFSNPILRKIARVVSASTYTLKLRRIVNAPIYKNFENLKATHVAPPGIDLRTFFSKAENLNFENRALIIGCIGRAQIWKGTKDIVEAIQSLREEGFNIRLRVAFHLPKDFNNFDWIDFVQPHGDEKLAEFYRGCDFFIAAGKIQYGAFHYPAAESLAVGTCLVSSPYFPASDENAYLFDECSPNAIATAVRKAIHDVGVVREARVKNGLRDVIDMSWTQAAANFLKHATSL